MAQHLEIMLYMLVTQGSNLWVLADDNVSLPDIGVEPSHYALETVFPMSCGILNAYTCSLSKVRFTWYLDYIYD